MQEKYPDGILSGMGGIESGTDAAEFIAVGAHFVQLCTLIMSPPPYGSLKAIQRLTRELDEWMDRKGFDTLADFRGTLLPKIVELDDLAAAQAASKGATITLAPGVDDDWNAATFSEQTKALEG